MLFGSVITWLKIIQTLQVGGVLNPQEILLKMVIEIFKIDASRAEKLMKTRVQFLLTPTVEPSKQL